MNSTLLAAALLSAASLGQVGFHTDLDPHVDRAARSFRISTYNDYRAERNEYDRRFDAGRQLVDNWFAAGQPADQRDAVVSWFERAEKAQSGDGLPETIEFQAAAEEPSVASPSPLDLTPPQPQVPDLLNTPAAEAAVEDDARETDVDQEAPTLEPPTLEAPTPEAPELEAPENDQAEGAPLNETVAAGEPDYRPVRSLMSAVFNATYSMSYGSDNWLLKRPLPKLHGANGL